MIELYAGVDNAEHDARTIIGLFKTSGNGVGRMGQDVVYIGVVAGVIRLRLHHIVDVHLDHIVQRRHLIEGVDGHVTYGNVFDFFNHFYAGNACQRTEVGVGKLDPARNGSLTVLYEWLGKGTSSRGNRRKQRLLLSVGLYGPCIYGLTLLKFGKHQARTC